MESLCEEFEKTRLFCSITNTSDIYDNFRSTQLFIKNFNINLNPYPTEPVFLKEDIQKHLYDCSYRYIDYTKRQIFCDTEIEYLDRAMILFVSKMGILINGITVDLQIEMLYMAYHIDDKIIKQINKFL